MTAISDTRNEVAPLRYRRTELLDRLLLLVVASLRSAFNSRLPLQPQGRLHLSEALSVETRRVKYEDRHITARTMTMMTTHVGLSIFTACASHIIYAPGLFSHGTNLSMHQSFQLRLAHSVNALSQIRAELPHEASN